MTLHKVILNGTPHPVHVYSDDGTQVIAEYPPLPNGGFCASTFSMEIGHNQDGTCLHSPLVYGEPDWSTVPHIPEGHMADDFILIVSPSAVEAFARVMTANVPASQNWRKLGVAGTGPNAAVRDAKGQLIGTKYIHVIDMQRYRSELGTEIDLSIV